MKKAKKLGVGKKIDKEAIHNLSVTFAENIITEIDKQITIKNYELNDHNEAVRLSLCYAFALMILKQWEEALTDMNFEEFIDYNVKPIYAALEGCGGRPKIRVIQ